MKLVIALFFIAAAVTHAQSIVLFDEPVDKSLNPFNPTREGVDTSQAEISVQDAYTLAEKEATLPGPSELFKIIEVQIGDLNPTRIEISVRSGGVGSIDRNKPALTFSWYVVKLGFEDKKWVYFALLEDRTILWGNKTGD
jgi:hypothetical protein